MKTRTLFLIAGVILIVFAIGASLATAGPSTGNPCKPGFTNGSGVIVGTAGNDKLCGGNAKDYIEGKAGNDVLAGNHGNDQIYGGSGDDRIWPGKGQDFVDCGSGRDVVFTNFVANGVHLECEVFIDPA